MMMEEVMGSSFGASLIQETEGSEHWLSPTDLASYVDVRPGMTVVEIGAGAGFYALPTARRTGPNGVVFAVEWRPWLTDRLRARLDQPDVPENVRLVAAHPAATHLPTASADVVLFADIWHTLEDCEAALDESRRLLRGDGRLVILNWRPEGLCPPGPPVERRVSMRSAICTVEMKSWSLVKSADIGSDGYLLVFEITDESVQS
jgi:ubiquinone/menaquinone biosynthesis C-methylase UbiE